MEKGTHYRHHRDEIAKSLRLSETVKQYSLFNTQIAREEKKRDERKTTNKKRLKRHDN